MSAIAAKAASVNVWKAMHWDEGALIPASEVLICWKDGLLRGITDVMVTRFPNDAHYFDNYWDGTSGACYGDWLKPGEHTTTPENMFGEMPAFYGFATKEVAEKAIIMFARIKECNWARKMLASDSYERLAKAGLVAHWR